MKEKGGKKKSNSSVIFPINCRFGIGTGVGGVFGQEILCPI